MKDCGIHILTLKETKIDDNRPKDFLSIDEGVDLYVSNTVAADVHDELYSLSLAAQRIEAKPVKAKPSFVATWYGPPSDHIKTFHQLNKFFRVLDAENKEVISLGELPVLLELSRKILTVLDLIFYLAKS